MSEELRDMLNCLRNMLPIVSHVEFSLYRHGGPASKGSYWDQQVPVVQVNDRRMPVYFRVNEKAGYVEINVVEGKARKSKFGSLVSDDEFIGFSVIFYPQEGDYRVGNISCKYDGEYREDCLYLISFLESKGIGIEWKRELGYGKYNLDPVVAKESKLKTLNSEIQENNKQLQKDKERIRQIMEEAEKKCECLKQMCSEIQQQNELLKKERRALEI